ncbi:homocysteine S-methyltransferase family protein [Demequina flava]|uniref:homocysteine S-methyltransferase family protein n=1 Tax=Demequina flava TaxID=1095025 RepID=UPI0007845F36|nr:homocysteine S-methyltransferase family protein [Demequina flava]
MSSLTPASALTSEDALYLAYFGMETDLVFTQGVELPGFASFPLLETPEGRRLLSGYAQGVVDIARRHGTGALLDTCTWVASPERAAALGYSSADLSRVYRDAVALVAKVRDDNPCVTALLSAQIGPRDDGYAHDALMTAAEAQDYHQVQVAALGDAGAEVLMAATIGSVDEALGLVRAARDCDLPVLMSFTLGTDGLLPDGSTLGDAIDAVDRGTEAFALGYLINCVHPDHLTGVLAGTWVERVRGVVANASRKTHEELDNAAELDSGDPIELGEQLAVLRAHHPHLTVLGGCCGTSMEHMTSIASQGRSRLA